MKDQTNLESAAQEPASSAGQLETGNASQTPVVSFQQRVRDFLASLCVGKKGGANEAEPPADDKGHLPWYLKCVDHLLLKHS